MSLTVTYGSLNLTATPYLVEFGLDTGAPQNVTEALALLLQDGEVEMSSRASNRTLAFNVLIEGANLLALATAEAALVAETEKILNTLTVDPGDSGPATVYEIFRGQVSLVRDDDWEQSRIRRYSVTIKALPFPRSAAETVTAALAASGSTTTLVNDGSATTNWTGTINGGAVTPAVVSGAVGVTSSALAGSVTASLTYAAAITTSATKILVIDWRGASVTQSPTLRAYGNGVELSLLATGPSPTADYTRTWFEVPAATSSINPLRLDSVSTSPLSSNPNDLTVVRSLFVDNINRTDIRPTFGTARQLLRSLTVTGPARAQGALAVEHASSSLGDVVVYTYADNDVTQGYTPPLRQYRTAGGTVTADSALVSGSREDIKAGAVTFDVPLARLIQGSHILAARMNSTEITAMAATISWSAQVRLGGTAVGTALSGTTIVTLPGTNGADYAIFPLTRQTLPPMDVNVGSTALLRVTLSATSAAAVVRLDEAWLFNTTIGQYTQAPCGTGTAAAGGPSNRLFMEPPTVATPRPTIRRGFASTRLDAFHASPVAWTLPQFQGPRVNVFTVTTNALDASVTMRYYPRWHSHAAS